MRRVHHRAAQDEALCGASPIVIAGRYFGGAVGRLRLLARFLAGSGGYRANASEQVLAKFRFYTSGSEATMIAIARLHSVHRPAVLEDSDDELQEQLWTTTFQETSYALEAAGNSLFRPTGAGGGIRAWLAATIHRLLLFLKTPYPLKEDLRENESCQNMFWAVRKIKWVRKQWGECFAPLQQK